MITVGIEQKSGTLARRVTVNAPSIERAVEMAASQAGADSARVLFPIDAEVFFTPASKEGIAYELMSPEDFEAACKANLPGACEAYLGALKDDLEERTLTSLEKGAREVIAYPCPH